MKKKDEQQTPQNEQEELLQEDADTQAEQELDREQMSDEEYISALELRLGKALSEAESCKAVAQRIQADFDNYRKRNNSMAEEMKALGQSIVIEKLLSVLDNCDLARKYVQDEAALTGFNMMEGQLLTALTGFGLEAIESVGKPFDAKLMNAVERVRDEQNAGLVTEELQKGYLLGGKLLRPASVKVAYWD